VTTRRHRHARHRSASTVRGSPSSDGWWGCLTLPTGQTDPHMSAAQCGPLMAAFLEIGNPEHPTRVLARECTPALTTRIVETAREAGASPPPGRMS
jgi:hypothetical protein